MEAAADAEAETAAQKMKAAVPADEIPLLASAETTAADMEIAEATDEFGGCLGMSVVPME